MKKIAFIIIVLATGLLFFTNCNGEKKYKEVVVEVFEDGFPQKVDYYIQDSILAKTVLYHSNHMIHVEGNFKNQERDGLWRSWYDNGNLWVEAHYQNDVQNGSYRTFYYNGNLLREERFQNGVLTGSCRVFYENGQLHAKGHYKDGEQTGTWNFYDEDGTLLKTEKY